MSTDAPEPPRDHQSRAPTPGIRVRSSVVQGAEIDVSGDRSLLELHRALLEAGLRRPVWNALRALEGDTPGDRRAVLLEAHGVEALNGHVAAAMAEAAEDLRHVDLGQLDQEEARDLEALDQLLAELGDGTADGVPSELGDLDDALPPLFANSATTPHVTVRLGLSWASRRPEQRAAVLRWLARFALGARVDLVATEAAARVMVNQHRDVLPAGALRTLCNRGHQPPGPLAGEAAAATEARQEAATEALGALEAEGRPIGLLRALGRVAGHGASYDDLARETALDRDELHEPARVLSEHGLIERVDSPTGDRIVSLLPCGLDVLRRLSSSAGAVRSGAAAGGSGASGEVSGTVSDHPKISPAMPCGPGGTREAPSPSEAAAPDRTAPADDESDRWHAGTVYPRLASRRRSVPVHAAGEAGEVVLADTPRDEDHTDPNGVPLDELDPRQPVVSYDGADDEVMLGYGRYQNPMQSWVALALGATSEELWGEADLEERIGDGLAGLEVSEHSALWSTVCAGWIPADVNDGEALHDSLRGARDDLRDELRERDLHNQTADADEAEVAANRRAVAAKAAGLLTTVVDVLDLAGIDVLLELRIANCSGHWSHGNERRRADLLEHVSRLALLNSRIGAWSTWRQMFENREEVRSDGFTPGWDEVRTGSLNCGIVVTGGTVEQLVDDLEERLAKKTTHDDAPAAGIDVPVRTGTDSTALAEAARRMFWAKGFRRSAPPVMVMAAFASDPWAVCDALHFGLQSEAGREVYLDECRTALATLHHKRLVSDLEAGKAQAGLAALLRAEAPLSIAELCRRGDLSRPTWNNYRDDLEALDVIRETSEGWRVCLPRRDERGRDVPEAAAPWWLTEESDMAGDVGADGRRPVDVLDWLVWDRHGLGLEDLSGPVAAAIDSLTTGDPPDRPTVDAALQDLGAPPSLVRAGCRGAGRPAPATVRVGALKQSRLSSHAPQISPTG